MAPRGQIWRLAAWDSLGGATMDDKGEVMERQKDNLTADSKEADYIDNNRPPAGA